jgi:hypothetical protein
MVESFDTKFAHIAVEHGTCDICDGCTHDLKRINLTSVIFGRVMSMMTGNTGTKIYRTTPKVYRLGFALLEHKHSGNVQEKIGELSGASGNIQGNLSE